MGIKDNFSQAVKELWKKDGQDKNNDNRQPGGDNTSELDRYLRGENGDKGNTVSSVGEATGNVPLETPYYRNVTDNQAQSTKPQSFNAADTAQSAQQNQQQGGQSTQPAQSAAQVNQQAGQQYNGAQPSAEQSLQTGFPDPSGAQNGQSSYNQNIANIRNNFGQNSAAGRAEQNDQGGYGGSQGGNNGGEGGYGGNQGGYGGGQGGYGGDRGGYGGGQGGYGGGQGGYGGYGGEPPMGGGIPANRNETDEITVISKNTIIDGNIRSLANMQIDGNIKGNVETTRNVDMSGKVIGDVICNNAGMASAAMQGNISLKGRMRMDRDTILIGDLSSQYADINGRIRGKLDIVGKAELKRDAVVFGDINASTIAVTDGAIIQGYVNTTFLSKEDSRNVFPDAISIDNKEVKNET